MELANHTSFLTTTYLRVGDGLAALVLVDDLRLFVNQLRQLQKQNEAEQGG